jgi:pimeloyl-ACP methyl ester carboxylesterase
MKKEISIQGKKILYRSRGEGPCVVLLHGFAEDGMVWKEQFDALEGFRLIAPDLPGSGGSEMTDDMTMEGLSDTVYELLRQLEVAECTVIGHSMGGYVTLAFAEKYPHLLKSYGLFHSTAFPDSEEKKEIRRKGIRFIETHGGFEFIKTSTPNLYSPVTRDEKPELIDEHIAYLYNFSGAALVRYYRSMMERPDRTIVLTKAKIPVLFILGAHDTAVSLEDSLKLCHLPLLSYIHILENSGHMGMNEEADQSNKILINYLESIHHQTR